MLHAAKSTTKKMMKALGYDIVRSVSVPRDFDASDKTLWTLVRPFTQTQPESVFALRRAVEYIVASNVPGDIVECGVWKGGSAMAIASTLRRLHATRRIHLFDTFGGMTPPTSHDVDIFGNSAAGYLLKSPAMNFSPIDEVRRNLHGTGYDPSLVHYIKGPVEVTLPSDAPEAISLLRLDTDWYESTYHELVHLFPRLAIGGVLIIDDYGHWHGARKATDQYFGECGIKMLLNRIDYTARIGVKLESNPPGVLAA